MNYLYNPHSEKISIASPKGISQMRELVHYEAVGNIPEENRAIEDEILAMLLEHPMVVWYNSQRPDERLNPIRVGHLWSLKTHSRFMSMVAVPNSMFVVSRVETRDYATYYYGSTVTKTVIERAIRLYYIDLAISLAK